MTGIISFVAGGIATAVGFNVITANNNKIEYVPYEQNIPEITMEVTPLEVIPYTKSSTIKVIKTNRIVDSTKDPIWEVQLFVDGKNVDKVDALIGRASRQNLNRHTAGNKSPLPVGRYSIDRPGISGPPFSDPELGNGYWIPVEPMFSTGRSYLGFHQDPSWGKQNGESGTSGCIGLKTVQDTLKVTDWIKKYNIQEISVES